MMTNQDHNPKSRLTPEEIDDFEIVVQTALPDDTKEALAANFPPEQLQEWHLIDQHLKDGWMLLHELRSKSTKQLLHARLMPYYHGRQRGEPPFILVAWVVTPDRIDPATGQNLGKGKGYGSYLREPSLEMTKYQKPHALGLVAERESPKEATSSTEQSVKRASWMKRIGLYRVDGINYEIPPYPTEEEEERGQYVPVAQRQKKIKPADLLLTRFDGKETVEGKTVASIIERLYTLGYGIQPTDEYYVRQMAQIDPSRVYNLVVG